MSETAFERIGWCDIIHRMYPRGKGMSDGEVTLRRNTMNEIMENQIARNKPDGFMLVRCELLDSSLMGAQWVLPFGPFNTYKEPPDHPFSVYGTASSMVCVKAVHWLEKTKEPEEEA